MDLREIKLVITDLDGTLLNSKHEVSSKFFQQFNMLQSLNIKFIAASGRPYYSIKNKLQTIKNEIGIIAENGGIIADHKHVLVPKSINKSKIQAIADALQNKTDIVKIFCTKDLAYIFKTSEEYIRIVTEYYSNYKLIDSVNDISGQIVKIALYHKEHSEHYIYPHVKSFEKENLVTISSPNWVDISENGVNKGNALRIFQKEHGVKKSETLAFGDFNNDIEMLKASKHSVAMANAHERVKAIARYETSSNDNFGVEKILDELIVQKTSSRKQ